MYPSTLLQLLGLLPPPYCAAAAANHTPFLYDCFSILIPPLFFFCYFIPSTPLLLLLSPHHFTFLLLMLHLPPLLLHPSHLLPHPSLHLLFILLRLLDKVKSSKGAATYSNNCERRLVTLFYIPAHSIPPPHRKKVEYTQQQIL